MILEEMTRRELIDYTISLQHELAKKKHLEGRLTEALRASEQRFRTVWDRDRDAIMIIDMEGLGKGQIVSANRVAAEMREYELDELLSLKIADLDTPDSAESLLDRIERILRGEWFTEAATHRRKNGSVFQVEMSAGLIELDNHKYILAIERDITERDGADERLRKSEAELRASQTQFEAFMDNGPVIAFMRDDQGRYVYVNKPFVDNYNLTSAQVLGRTAGDIFPAEMARQVTKEDRNVVESSSTVATVETVVDQTGKQREWWLVRFPIKDANGRTYVGGVGLDLTERLAAQKALEASEARLRHIYENLPLMVHSVDRDGMIRNVNRKWLSHMGYDREEVIGRHLDNFLAKDSAAESRGVQSQLWTKGTASSIERRWVRKDGSCIDTVSNSIIMDDPVLGEVSLTAVHDITVLKRAKELIKESLKEKEVLLHEVNHRVKNNFQIISSLLRLQSRQVSRQNYRQMLQDIQNRLYTMALIHEKLYQSRSVAQIDVEHYLKSLVANLFHLYGAKSSRIKTTIDAQDLQLRVDKADPLGLIATELVSNCLKHAFPNGRPGTITISLTPQSSFFQFMVADDGVGLKEDFDPFNAESLGLQLVHTLVKQLHGSMAVKRPDGTEFCIKFPS